MKKVIAITGASSGIGKTTAKLLIDQGYTVYAFARSIDKMEELKTAGGHPVYMDVTDDVSVQQGFDYLFRQEGHIDVLINNAGYAVYGAVETVPLADAQAEMDVNLFGLARCCQQVLPMMRRQQAGLIINISSIAGKLTSPLGAWYFSSKYAVEGLSDSLRQEVNHLGIKVVLIEPGGVKSEWAGIAHRHLEVRVHEAYANLAEQVANFYPFDEDKNSDPMVIAHLILKAIRSKHPRTRYVGAKYARFFLFAKKILPDKWFDRAVLFQLSLSSRI